MEDNVRSKAEPDKFVVIYKGDRPCYVAFIDDEQEQKILKLLTDRRRLTQ